MKYLEHTSLEAPAEKVKPVLVRSTILIIIIVDDREFHNWRRSTLDHGITHWLLWVDHGETIPFVFCRG